MCILAMDSSRYVSDSQLFYIHFIGFLFKKNIYIYLYTCIFMCITYRIIYFNYDIGKY